MNPHVALLLPPEGAPSGFGRPGAAGMESLRRFHALVLADLRERVRSARFWTVIALTVGLTWLCFPPATAHYIVLGINSNHRGSFSSAWVGMVLGMLSIWSSLIGFYLVRGNLRRDVDTRVWELLEVTPLSRASYLLAKWSSHMVVLCLVLGAQLLVGLVAQWVRAEDAQIDIAQLVMPALLLGLPSLALTATFAVWFDMLPWLRRSAGNYVYMAVWLALLLVPLKAMDASGRGLGWLGDPRGVAVFNLAVHQRLDAKLDMPLKVCIGCVFPSRQVERFDWPAWHAEPAQLAGRLAWLALALGGVLLSAPLLNRMSVHTRRLEQQAAGHAAKAGSRWLDPLLRPLQRSPFGTLVAAELRLTLQRRSAWWWLSLLGAAAVQVAAPLQWAAFGVMLGWLLLTQVYSQAALRESSSRMSAIVFTAVDAGRRIFVARWGVLLGLGWLATLPATLRFAIDAPAVSLAIVLVGVSLASWGMALGAVTRNAHVAEVLLCVLAYLGTQGVALLNVGIAPEWTSSVHAALLPLAAVALWIGWPRLQRAAA